MRIVKLPIIFSRHVVLLVTLDVRKALNSTTLKDGSGGAYFSHTIVPTMNARVVYEELTRSKANSVFPLRPEPLKIRSWDVISKFYHDSLFSRDISVDTRLISFADRDAAPSDARNVEKAQRMDKDGQLEGF